VAPTGRLRGVPSACLGQGVPHALIASNLGHKDVSEVMHCYGRFAVHVAQWAVWEGRIERHAADERGAATGRK
jgi:hypothetical protein